MAKKRLKMGTSRDIRQSLNRIANMVLNEELDTRQANCIIYACTTALSALRTDELETRINELETTLEAVQAIQEKERTT